MKERGFLFWYNICEYNSFTFYFYFRYDYREFLNVVIDRHGICSLKGRSKCDVTGKFYCWYELVPVISFLIQGGRSRYSKTKISWQYPLVEIATGLSFVFLQKLLHFFFGEYVSSVCYKYLVLLSQSFRF